MGAAKGRDLFAIARDDGRSYTQVLVDLVRDAVPGTLYQYAQLGKVLGEGTTRRFTTRDVCAVVNRALGQLLKEEQRTLRNVRGVGYLLCSAADHLPLAVTRRRRADVQLHRGLELLRHARLDELPENLRQLHTGQLMILEAVASVVASHERRLSRVEAAIQGLVGPKVS